MNTPGLLKAHAFAVRDGLERALDRIAATTPAPLHDAMRYSLLAGGKRIRPALLLECYAACGGDAARLQARALPAALSVECLHTYSLVHDDLPCMDDDDLRRGQPTCHRRFGEATAILAADALQALAFELLAECDVDAERRILLVRKLAHAAGAQGMVGGQMLDMEAEESRVDSVFEIERIHIHKTGALLRYCCEAGALLAGGGDRAVEACSRFGEAVGLLFQIADDILDASATTEQLGKSAGKDAAQHKATYVSLLGEPRAGELADEMLGIALDALKPLGEHGAPLAELARYILERRR